MAQASKVSGVVQINGSPTERTVRAFGYGETLHTVDGEGVTLSKSLGHTTSDPATGEYTINLLNGYESQVFVVAFDDYGNDFSPELALNVGDRVHPTTPNGHVFEAAGAGTLPAEEPVWIVDTETAQLYGTASMIARPFYRPMVHGPVAPEVSAPIEPPAPELPTVIGEAYGGGFYAGDIEYGGKHYKLIVAEKAAEASLMHKTSNTNTTGISSNFDGRANTLAMGDPEHPAAMHCLNYEASSDREWYLPAKDELNLICTNLSPRSETTPEPFKSGGTQALVESNSIYYWASTQHTAGGSFAWRQRTTDNEQGGGYKNVDTYIARPVRRVEFTPRP